MSWLLQRDTLPELVVLEKLEGDEREWPREKAWIMRLFEAGHPLTNQNGILENYDEEVLQEAIRRGEEMFSDIP
jgi:hypothetical protein